MKKINKRIGGGGTLQNKIGFTLIELLAVIVILAIIALIATPIVLNIINESKESANLRSAEMYVGAVETSIATSTLNNQKLSNGTYEIVSGNICLEYSDNKCTKEIKVEVKGETPVNGKITVSNGQLVDLILNYEDKTIVKSDNKLVYEYKEQENIEVPDLYNNTLTPVVYDGDNWVIADASKKWYDYNKQEWANAVILKNGLDKKVGDTITVDGDNPDALAMLVWIPRYEYRIEGTYGKSGTSTTDPGEIEVNFISTNTKEASEDYRIHPAFNFGGTDISGIWVGKFELSHTTIINESIGCTDESCREGNNLRILPNLQSLRKNTVSSFFYGIRSMTKENNVFGIEANITDTHMIKNSEWGAVAYLSQSKYGKYGNSDYEERKKEVYINNSGNAYTGRSGGSYGGNTPINETYVDQTSEMQYTSTGYYTYDGYLLEYNTNTKTETRDMKKIASTTGNIYGIYDMSGGAWEYVMGVFANSDGRLWSGTSIDSNSGFKGKVGAEGIDIEGLEWPEEKYYDAYKASSGITISSSTACDGGICNGHAISETTNWYGDSLNFVSATGPWSFRGGLSNYENGAGIFGMGATYGRENGNGSTRVVFTPTA